MKILLTGASGFVGSAFVRRAVKTDHHVRAVVRHTNEQRLNHRLTQHPEVIDAIKQGRLELIYTDLLGDISGLCEGIDTVVNAAAKTFVDHSIRDPWPFVETNIIGSYRILEEARRCKVARFVQVSTDEVYGAILNGAYDENARLNPTNPYSAAKASADCLAISYAHTYGMNTVVTRTENNYGPYQHPQKVFPVFVRSVMRGEPLPVYGDGQHIRQWLWVDDHVDALLLLCDPTIGGPGEIYHVAGSKELTNIELAYRIIKAVKFRDNMSVDELNKHIRFIPDHDIRPGHDRRYALKSDKIQALGWKAKVELDVGIAQAARWYAANDYWHG